MPVAMDRTFRVRISRRPWPRSVSRSAAGTSRQGRAVSCGVQAGLVAFDGEDPVRAAPGEVGDVITLAVQRVSGDHGAAQIVDLVEQGVEAGDLVGLRVDVSAGQHDAGRLLGGGQDVAGRSVGVREPRRVLPSTAIARRAPGSGAGIRAASQAPIAAVSRSASMACSSLRIIASDGRRPTSMPSSSAASAGRSATHSPIAVYERHPAATAQIAAVTTTVSRWRIPGGRVDQGTAARAAGRSAVTSCGHESGRCRRQRGNQR